VPQSLHRKKDEASFARDPKVLRVPRDCEEAAGAAPLRFFRGVQRGLPADSGGVQSGLLQALRALRPRELPLASPEQPRSRALEGFQRGQVRRPAVRLQAESQPAAAAHHFSRRSDCGGVPHVQRSEGFFPHEPLRAPGLLAADSEPRPHVPVLLERGSRKPGPTKGTSCCTRPPTPISSTSSPRSKSRRLAARPPSESSSRGTPEPSSGQASSPKAARS